HATTASSLSLHDALPICPCSTAPYADDYNAARQDRMRQHGNQLMVAAALVAAPAVAIILGQTPTPAGVYTTEQAVAGRLAYEVRSEEHTSELQSRAEIVC